MGSWRNFFVIIFLHGNTGRQSVWTLRKVFSLLGRRVDTILTRWKFWVVRNNEKFCITFMYKARRIYGIETYFISCPSFLYPAQFFFPPGAQTFFLPHKLLSDMQKFIFLLFPFFVSLVLILFETFSLSYSKRRSLKLL